MFADFRAGRTQQLALAPIGRASGTVPTMPGPGWRCWSLGCRSRRCGYLPSTLGAYLGVPKVRYSRILWTEDNRRTPQVLRRVTHSKQRRRRCYSDWRLIILGCHFGPILSPPSLPPAPSWRALAPAWLNGSPHDEPHSRVRLARRCERSWALGGSNAGRAAQGVTRLPRSPNTWAPAVGPDPGSDWRRGMSDGIRVCLTWNLDAGNPRSCIHSVAS